MFFKFTNSTVRINLDSLLTYSKIKDQLSRWKLEYVLKYNVDSGHNYGSFSAKEHIEFKTEAEVDNELSRLDAALNLTD